MDYIVRSKIGRYPAFYDKEQKERLLILGNLEISKENMYLLKDKEMLIE